MKSLLPILVFASVAVFAQNQPLINVADGKAVALEDFRGSKGVVIIFTSNVCAYDGYYSDRLKSLFTTYGGSFQFVLVNSYQEAEETPDKMKARYDLWAYGIPYLADKDQAWMKALGARKSPEVFILDSSSKVVYSGAIDDNPQLANAVKENYLKKALDALISGKGNDVANTRAVGCSIRSK
jgi:hypothetical protein